MLRQDRRTLVKTVGGIATVGLLAGCAEEEVPAEEPEEPAEEEVPAEEPEEPAEEEVPAEEPEEPAEEEVPAEEDEL